jgi:hypothetical protein
LTGTKVEGGFVHYIRNSPHFWGVQLKTSQDGDFPRMKLDSAKWMFQSKGNNGTMAAKVDWDNATKKAKTEVALKLNMQNWKWMFRVNNSSLLRVAV